MMSLASIHAKQAVSDVLLSHMKNFTDYIFLRCYYIKLHISWAYADTDRHNELLILKALIRIPFIQHDCGSLLIEFVTERNTTLVNNTTYNTTKNSATKHYSSKYHNIQHKKT